MNIGILSDSHLKSDYTKDVIDFLKKEDCQYFVHAGDLCIEKNLQLLEESNLSYVAVFGNNDRSLLSLASKYNIKNEPYYFKIKDIKFKLTPLFLSAEKTSNPEQASDFSLRLQWQDLLQKSLSSLLQLIPMIKETPGRVS